MHTHDQIQDEFHKEILRSWELNMESLPEGTNHIRVSHLADDDVIRAWAGTDLDWQRVWTVKDWIRRGPDQSALYGKDSELFRTFCDRIGVDYLTLIRRQPDARQEVFRQRLRGKLDQYKRKTGRSMKDLVGHLEWSDTEYQWLRRIASKGVSQARSKKNQLTQLATELDTSLEYLFGESDSVELPTLDAIIALGIQAFAKRQPKGTVYSDPDNVRKYFSE